MWLSGIWVLVLCAKTAFVLIWSWMLPEYKTPTTKQPTWILRRFWRLNRSGGRCLVEVPTLISPKKPPRNYFSRLIILAIMENFRKASFLLSKHIPSIKPVYTVCLENILSVLRLYYGFFSAAFFILDSWVHYVRTWGGQIFLHPVWSYLYIQPDMQISYAQMWSLQRSIHELVRAELCMLHI